MNQTVRFRIVVEKPVPGVELRLQRGRDELIEPKARTAKSATFEFTLDVVTKPGGAMTLRGAEAQGPPAERFVYINAGTYAGDANSPWGRRAKVPLKSVTQALITKALASSRSVIVGSIAGTAKDGGPAAATVPLLDGWSVK